MTRCVTVVALAWILAGCHAPAPSFNVLAPYGSATIPPPRTGAVGTGGTYYAPGTQPSATDPATTIPPAVLPPAAMRTSGRSVPPPASYVGDSAGPLSDPVPNVVPASFEPGSTARADLAAASVTDEVLPPSATPPASDSSSALQLNGMRVSDATKLDEPKHLDPPGEPVNIANLPSASSAGPSFLRFISPKSTARGGTGTPTPAPPPGGAWQSR